MKEAVNEKQPKKESTFDRILLACGYVLICLLLIGVLGIVLLAGAILATALFAVVLAGIAEFVGGLILTGAGLVHMISMPRGSVINVGLGMAVSILGILTELFLFWVALDVVPWMIGKVRKEKPHVMAKDIRGYCGRVLRTGLILGGIGIVLIVVGLLLGGASDIRKRSVLAYRETMEAIEDTARMLPFSKSFQNMNLLSFDYKDRVFSVGLNDYYDLYHGDKEYTKVADASEVRSLKVSALSGVFSILPNENDEYAVQSFESGDYQVFLEGGTLIVDIYPYLHSAKEEDLPQVMLLVPKDVYFESFELYCSGRAMVSTADLKGDEAYVFFPMGEALFLDRMDFKSVHIQSGLGDLTVEHLTADEVFADAGSGEMVLKDVSVGNVSLTESSGKLIVLGKILGDISIQCGVGEVRILLDGFTADDYHLALKGTPNEMRIGETNYKGYPLFVSKEASKDVAKDGMKVKTISADVRIGRVSVE